MDKGVIAITLFCVRSNLLVYEQKISNYISSIQQIASHAKKRGRNDNTAIFIPPKTPTIILPQKPSQPFVGRILYHQKPFLRCRDEPNFDDFL